MTVRQIIREPFEIHGVGIELLKSEVQRLLKRMGLPLSADKYPHEFSGGQRQQSGLPVLCFESKTCYL